MGQIDWLTRPASIVSTRLRHRAPAICHRLVDLVYPPCCAGCEIELSQPSDGIELCDRCRLAFAPPVEAYCSRCSAVVRGETAGDCRYCKGQAFRWRQAVALGNYRTALRDAILQTKQAKGERVARALAEMLCRQRLPELQALAADLVAPIPLFWRRRFVRQTSGPEVMATAIARALRRPLSTRVLRRTRATPLQTDSTPRQRRIAQRGSFAVRGDRQVQGRCILLVDDVLTTGATCDEAAKTLLRAGAEKVVVAVIARAVGDDAL